jgi:hypothetical protein
MFSLIKLSWQEAEEEFEKLLNSLNHPGSFKFDNDFIVKTALVIMDKKARYEVKKFKGEAGDKNLLFLKNNWEKIKKGFDWLKDFLKYARIESDETLPSYNALIPIIFYAYINDCKINSAKVKINIQTWLYKVLLNGNFGGQSDQIIDVCVDEIKEKSQVDYFPYLEIEESIKRRFNRVVDVNENIIDGNNYLVLNIIYLFNKQIVNFQPALIGHNPEIDHIFPKSKTLGKDFRYSPSLVNDIGNLMFLEKSLNIEKRDKLPKEYFRIAKREQKDYLTRNTIPEDRRLHDPENFEDFVIERRKMIFEILKQILRYQDGLKNQKPKGIATQKKHEWDNEEIYQYLNESREWRPLNYCLFKILSEFEGEISYYDLVDKIAKISSRQITYHQFGAVLAGITKMIKRRDKEKLIDSGADGLTFFLNQKYRKAIRDYFAGLN